MSKARHQLNHRTVPMRRRVSNPSRRLSWSAVACSKIRKPVSMVSHRHHNRGKISRGIHLSNLSKQFATTGTWPQQILRIAMGLTVVDQIHSWFIRGGCAATYRRRLSSRRISSCPASSNRNISTWVVSKCKILRAVSSAEANQTWAAVVFKVANRDRGRDLNWFSVRKKLRVRWRSSPLLRLPTNHQD